jgi:hypothetical protein
VPVIKIIQQWKFNYNISIPLPPNFLNNINREPHFFDYGYKMQKRLSFYSWMVIWNLLWNIMLCTLMKVNKHFRETYCLHLKRWRVSQPRNQHVELCLPPASCCVLAGLILQSWWWRWYVSLKCWLAFTGPVPYISEDRSIHRHCENLKSDIRWCLFPNSFNFMLN